MSKVGNPSTVPHDAPLSNSSLDWPRVATAIAGEPVGYQFVYLPITSSTNDVARNLAAAGAPEGVVVYADAQTAGRGRPGKSPWLTPPNASIAVSIVLRPPLAPDKLPYLTMAAGVASVDAIRETTGVPATLKWPNDIMASCRKVGGILAESALSGAAVAYVVLGIGLNCNFPAAALGPLPDAAVSPTSLQDGTGTPISREDLLIAILRRFGRVYGHLQAGHATSTSCVWRSYRTALGMLGQPVRVLSDPQNLGTLSNAEHPAPLTPIDGTAEDITPEGALVVRLPSGARQVFTFGDVSVR